MSPVIQFCPYRCGELLGECVRDEHGRLMCRATGTSPPDVRSALYFSPDRDHLGDLLKAFAQVPDCTLLQGLDARGVRYQGISLHFVSDHSVDRLLERLHCGYYNLVVIDLRALSGRDEEAQQNLTRALQLVEAMDAETDPETRYGLHRVVALVSACDEDLADRIIAQLARKGIGTILRDRTKRPLDDAGGDPAFGAFGRRLLPTMCELMTQRKRGKKALCASGGGITGIYFEMGVLKCLDDCLDVGVHGLFDMYYGISAGAVITGLLANGYTVDEGMAAIAAQQGGRIPPLDLGLLRLSHVNFADMRDRVLGAVRYLLGELVRRRRRPGSLSAEALVLQAGDLIGPPLRGDAFEKTLRELFAAPGTTNDFRKLARPLYIGTTDQDTRAHVLFGDQGLDDVPISLAIQASFSINPAFASTRIRGRYYEDGAVTQTSNFVDGIRKGADLIFIVDPFVPYVSKSPGFARRRGVLYNADQDLRTLSYTRFEQQRNAVLRRHGEVSSYTFLPANRLRKLMSVNPMDHRPYLPIWRAAYLSTFQRIQQLKHRMCGDLAVHGAQLDTRKAEEVAARLETVTSPKLADFFVDRRIELRAPARVPASAPSIDACSPGAALQNPQTSAA